MSEILYGTVFAQSEPYGMNLHLPRLQIRNSSERPQNRPSCRAKDKIFSELVCKANTVLFRFLVSFNPSVDDD
ncbi:hypothetical protein SUGI_0197000 [Cryptomeria japonica]|nr:hypothetical protein SUGI_0197000 [Cryptomeria japonica]